MITLQGELSISVDTVSARLTAQGAMLRLELDDPIAFFRASRMFHRSSLEAVRMLASQLTRNGLTLSISSRDKILVVIGSEAKAGIAGSLLGVPYLEVLAAGLISRMAG